MEKEKEKATNKTKWMIIISVIGALAIIIGVSYAWFTLTLTGTKTQVIKTGTLELTIDESASDGITLNAAMPITDEEGMRTTSYKFTLKNTGTMDAKYTLKLIDQTITGTRMPDSVVKYYFVKDGVSQGPLLLNTVTDRIFDSGYLAPNESHEYELKLWIDYDAGNEIQGNIFNAKISVDSEQLVPTPEQCFTFDSSTGAITKYLCGPTITDSSSYSYSENTSLPDGVSSYITDVVIPSEIDGVAVTKIVNSTVSPFGAFGYTGINSVVIPDSVTSVGDFSFYGAGLTSVVLPSNITAISYQSFTANKLISVTIPESVTYIDQLAFGYNELTSVTIPKNVNAIYSSAFFGNKLTSVIIEEKSETADFTAYGSNGESPFGWASGSTCATHTDGDDTNPCIRWNS